MISETSLLRRTTLLGCASIATLALFTMPSRAEQQLFTFFVNGTTSNDVTNGAFGGPQTNFSTGCCATYYGPGQAASVGPVVLPGGFNTTSSGPGAISEASAPGNVGTRGGAVVGTKATDAYDGYGAIGFKQGGGFVANFGGLTVARKVAATHGPTGQSTPITTAFTNGGVPNAVRWIETVTNNTGSTIAGSMVYANNLGSDANTTWVASSSGNLLSSTGIRWATSIQSGVPSDPVNTHVFGNNAYTLTTAQFLHANGDDNPEWRYPVNLAPGQTAKILLFDILTANINYNAGTVASDITLGGQLADIITNGGAPISADSSAFRAFFSDLTVAELQTVINYSFVGLTIDTSRPFFVQTDFAVNQSPAVFDGGTLKPTTTFTFAQPFVVHSAGGTIDNSNGDLTFNGQISDVGGLTFAGTNKTFLNATNTYTGATTVNGGTLMVNGSIASSSMTTVNAGGTLGGTGTVGNTTINGGTLAPGDPAGNIFGPLTITGSLVFTAASTYLIQVTPANASSVVTGTATLGGATVSANFAPGSFVAKRYTILNANGGLSGTFGTVVNTNLPSGFKTSLSYDTQNAFLDLALNFVPPPPGPSAPNFGAGLNVNQQNVGNALINFFNTSGGIPMVFGSLTPAGLTQASGEAATGSQQTTFDAMNLFMGVLTDPSVAGRGDAVAVQTPAAPQFTEEEERALSYAPDGQKRTKRERDAYAALYTKALKRAPDPDLRRWSVWAAAFGGSQTTTGNLALGSNTATSQVYGTAVGADYLLSPATIAGFALAGGATNFSLANLAGSGRSDLFQAGGFVRHTIGPAYLSAALAYGWQDLTTNRTVTVAGIDQLQARFRANAFSGRFEGGYRFVAPGAEVGLTPYAAAQFTTFRLPAYAEQTISGANTFALSYAGKDVTAPRSELGLRSDKSYVMHDDDVLTLRGRLAWAHNYNADRNVAATFQTLPGATFVVNGARQSSEAALTTGSAEWKWTSGFSLTGTFEGEFSSTTTSYAGKVVAAYTW
jgi:autotransporter-associated beta strand protein